MDEITKSVRAMYERYPYPHGTPELRALSDARLLLSYVERSRPGSVPVHVLDAGCGRGLGVIGSAVTQPGVRFLGVDMNRIALQNASNTAHELNLSNVGFQECDLMTLEGLRVPDGGFDVIYSLGVLHHMADPLTGLRNLKKVLAPHGVIALMLYARQGRAPLVRLQESIELLFPDNEPLAERVPLARSLADVARSGILSNTYWENTADVNEVEFVDRCLNVNEGTYEIASLWELLSRAGMRFIRWFEPEEWSLEKHLPAGDVLERALRLEKVDQYRLIEKMFWRNAFELIIAPEDNGPRQPFLREQLDYLSFAVNPDVSFSVESRCLRGAQRVEKLADVIRHRVAVNVENSTLSTALLLLKDQTESFTGHAWIEALASENISPDLARDILPELLDLEIVYSPHTLL